MSSRDPLISLTAVGQNAATEISICDARFREIELPNNAGSVDIELPAGMYKVIFQEGDASVEQIASLLPGSAPVRVDQERPASFRSAVPLDDTRTSHEWHQMPAVELSESAPSIVLGTARSELLIFVRDLGRPVVIELEESLRRRENLPEDIEFRLDLVAPIVRQFPGYEDLDALDPSEGLTLHDLSGRELTNVEPHDPRIRVGGLHARLDRATYRLRLDTGSKVVLEMPIVCVEDWETQVFLLCRRYGEDENSRRADLDSASVSLVRPGATFNPRARHRRLTELALTALAARRPLRGPQLTEILEEKFEDPMLGILGGHLLLLAPEPDVALLDLVIGNTAGLLGFHPDVEALRLRRALLDNHVPSPVPSFAAPPMLAASWDGVVAATRMSASVVPPGSLSDLVADRLTRRGPWLVWTQPDDQPPPGQAETSADPVRTVTEALSKRRAQDRARELKSVTPSEHALATTIQPAVDPFYRSLEGVGLVREQDSTPTAIDVSASLNLPVSTVERLARSLLAKL